VTITKKSYFTLFSQQQLLVLNQALMGAKYFQHNVYIPTKLNTPYKMTTLGRAHAGCWPGHDQEQAMPDQRASLHF